MERRFASAFSGIMGSDLARVGIMTYRVVV